MAKKFICGSEKYQIAGPNEDSIGLPVSIGGIPEKIEVEGYMLLRKTSFHVTLVAIGEIIKKLGVSVPDFQNKVIADFCGFAAENEIEFLRYRDEFRFVSENERRSVIAMCDISNLDAFYRTMSQKYGLRIEYPPTHVTIYTLQPDKGIFLTDFADIERLAKRIPNPGVMLS